MERRTTRTNTGVLAVLLALGAALVLFLSWLTRFPWEW